MVFVFCLDNIVLNNILRYKYVVSQQKWVKNTQNKISHTEKIQTKIVLNAH